MPAESHATSLIVWSERRAVCGAPSHGKECKGTMNRRETKGREARCHGPQSAGSVSSVNRAGLSIACAAWALLATLPLPVAADTALNARAQARPDGRVEILHMGLGSINVQGWERPEVEVTGRLGRGSERLDFNSEGGLVRIEVVLTPGDKGHILDTASKLVVWVPSGSDLSIRSGWDVKVRGVTGPQSVRSLNGRVSLSADAGSDRLVDISTGLGDARLDLIGTPDARFELTTVSGKFQNCFGPKGPHNDGRAGYRELRFTEGSGAGHVRIKTIGGDIRVCTKPP